jgi:hypothetical protein
MKHEYSGMAQIPYKHLTEHNDLTQGAGGKGFQNSMGLRTDHTGPTLHEFGKDESRSVSIFTFLLQHICVCACVN